MRLPLDPGVSTPWPCYDLLGHTDYCSCCQVVDVVVTRFRAVLHINTHFQCQFCARAGLPHYFSSSSLEFISCVSKNAEIIDKVDPCTVWTWNVSVFGMIVKLCGGTMSDWRQSKRSTHCTRSIHSVHRSSFTTKKSPWWCKPFGINICFCLDTKPKDSCNSVIQIAARLVSVLVSKFAQFFTSPFTHCIMCVCVLSFCTFYFEWLAWSGANRIHEKVHRNGKGRVRFVLHKMELMPKLVLDGATRAMSNGEEDHCTMRRVYCGSGQNQCDVAPGSSCWPLYSCPASLTVPSPWLQNPTLGRATVGGKFSLHSAVRATHCQQKP